MFYFYLTNFISRSTSPATAFSLLSVSEIGEELLGKGGHSSEESDAASPAPVSPVAMVVPLRAAPKELDEDQDEDDIAFQLEL